MADETEDRESRDYRSLPFRIAGSRGSSVSSPDTREDFDSIRPVANLMMGAAHADGKFCAAERETVRGLLCQLIGREELPESLSKQLAEFDPQRFDLQEAIADFQSNAHT